MNVEFVNVRKEKDVELFREVLQFAADRLISKQLQKKIFITLAVQSLPANVNAFCEWEDNYINPREFKITLSPRMSLEKKIQAIFHEMVHVKQYAKNELRERFQPNHKMYWKKEFIDRNEVAYRDLPWEVEAFHLQDVLTLAYINLLDFA